MFDPGSLQRHHDLTDRLAAAQREYAVRSNAYHRLYTETIIAMLDEGRSATESRVWADGAALELRVQFEILKAEIAALTTELSSLTFQLSLTQSGS